MAKIAEALRQAALQLEGISTSPRLDAEVLMAEALGVPRSDLLLRHMSAPAPAPFAALVERRLRSEPVAYILGRREFYGLDLVVTPDVLIPRWDSETLIDAARQELADRWPHRILDLGTGSGALLLAALSLWPKAEGAGIDRSPAALRIAQANADRLGFGDRVRFVEADWVAEGWSAGLGRFDLILANPPYVETGADLAPGVRDYEPAGALFAGEDGLDAYRVIIPQLPALLSEHGLAVLEIGATQDEAVRALANAAGLRPSLHRDLGGLPRAISVELHLAKPSASII